MTVIAWDGVTLAADKLNFGAVNSPITKIKMINGSLWGISGKTVLAQLLWKWIENGCIPEEIPDAQLDSERHGIMIRIDPDRSIYIYENSATPWKAEREIHALGTGCELALGAMEVGANAFQAVQVAIKYNSLCGLGFDMLTFPDKE